MSIQASTSNGERLMAMSKRWVEILTLAIMAAWVGLFTLWLIAPWIKSPDLAPLGFRRTLKLLVSAPWWVLPGLAGLGLLLKCLESSVWNGFPNPRARLRTVFLYPRLWMGALLGTALLVWAVGGWHCLGWLDLPESAVLLLRPWAPMGMGLFLALVGVGAGTCLFGYRRIIPQPQEAPPQEGESSGSKDAWVFRNFEELQSWLKDDAPVKTLDQDCFDHRGIARRMALRLCAPGPLPSQAVVGPLGSGKSTLGHLVQNAIDPRGVGCRVRLVQIELWPFSTPEAAVEGLLQELIDALRRDISITSLRGFPEKYWEAVSAAGGFWSVLGRLLRGRWNSPHQLLAHLDQAASAIGVRYVLWVEDLERFAGTSKALDAETPQQALTLAPIRALLHGLGQCHSLSVVTATTSLHAPFDLEKIARFVEPLPRLPETKARHLLDQFRRGCTEDWPGLIDPARASRPRQAFDGILLGEDGDVSFPRMRKSSPQRFENLRDALLDLCDTPRGLKQALRRSLDFWTALPGEIDFDHLLALNILRTCQPDVFALLHKHGRNLSWANTESFQESEIGKAILADPSMKPRGESPTVDEDRKREALIKITECLFGDQARKLLPQGVSAKGREEEHWRRFLTEPLLSPSERHQALFQRIQAADLDGLLDLLESPESSGEVAYFLSFLRREELGPLFAQLIHKWRSEDPAGWLLDDYSPVEPPGLSPWLEAFRFGKERTHSKGDLPWEVFLWEVNDCIDQNLVLTWRLKIALIDECNLGPNTYQEGALRQLLTSLRVHYSGAPDRLAEALQNARPGTLSVLCGRAASGVGDEIPFQPWGDFAATLLEAARRHPIPMLPQLAAMVVHRDDSDRSLLGRYRFIPRQAAKLFGSAEAVRALVEGRRLEEWTGIAARLVEPLFVPTPEP